MGDASGQMGSPMTSRPEGDPVDPPAAVPVVAGKVLVVDDQRNMRATTAIVLRQAGYLVAEAEDGASAIQRLSTETFDVVLTDLRMGAIDGMDVLRSALELAPSTQVIVMTAYGTIESAVEAIRRGAYDYLAKPFQEEELLLRVDKALEKRRLLGEMSLLAREFRARYGLEHIIGRSPAMREVLDRLVRVAPTDTTVLVTGESGTGKELVARALHSGSRRSHKPFVPVNCAAITETLLESELFGHAKGSFTGAIRARRGLFEEANGGTLFIDEIAETALGFQARLLRAIQEGEIRRVGESMPVQVNVRVIAASNQDLKKAIAEKRFREDLFYRLNVVPLRIPPLRERREDIPLLAAHFLQRYNERSRDRKTLSTAALSRLVDFSWPGNVRELENMIEQAAALSRDTEIGAADIRLESSTPEVAGQGGAQTLAQAVESAERRLIEAALVRSPGDLARVARELGISSTTLWRKMKRHGMGVRGTGSDPGQDASPGFRK
jgi:two-component system, NtrC family, response regulator HydG